MVFHWINAEFGIPGMYVFMLGSALAAYFILASASYLYFFYWKRDRYHPDYRPDRVANLNSMKWAFYSAAGNSALVVPVELMIIYGKSQVYFGIGDRGIAYLVLSAIIVLVIAETLIYWIHRVSHTKFLYQHLHRYHHRFREPTPFASIAFHPLDAFFQALPYHLCAFLLPLNVWVYHGFVMLATVWAVAIHDRVRLVPTEWVNHTGCHMVHHWYFAYNYGQFFTVWDRLCGTYRNASCLPDRFRASWPKDSHRAESEIAREAAG